MKLPRFAFKVLLGVCQMVNCCFEQETLAYLLYIGSYSIVPSMLYKDDFEATVKTQRTNHNFVQQVSDIIFCQRNPCLVSTNFPSRHLLSDLSRATLEKCENLDAEPEDLQMKLKAHHVIVVGCWTMLTM